MAGHRYDREAKLAALRKGGPERLISVFGSLDGAREAWQRMAGEVAATVPPGRRPEAYWQLTSGVPEDLRTVAHLGTVKLMVRFGANCPDVPACDHHAGRLRDGKRTAPWCARRWPDRLRAEWLRDNGLLTAAELADADADA